MASDVEDCPLCMNEMDATDRAFQPCPCGYQVCGFCWNRITQDMDNRCPACRREYDVETVRVIAAEPATLKSKSDGRKKNGNQTKKWNRKQLESVRVIQRNLVYVTNIAVAYAKQDILTQNEYFGQYGTIQKVVINKSTLFNAHSPNGPSVSAYLTFTNCDDALCCIHSMDGAWLDDRVVHASFGTTKYCTFFLRRTSCTNPECMYLHELGDEKDSYSKEDMSQGLRNFHEQTHPPPLYASVIQSSATRVAGTMLPPPVRREDIYKPLLQRGRGTGKKEKKKHTKHRQGQRTLSQSIPYVKKDVDASILPVNASWARRMEANKASEKEKDTERDFQRLSLDVERPRPVPSSTTETQPDPTPPVDAMRMPPLEPLEHRQHSRFDFARIPSGSASSYGQPSRPPGLDVTDSWQSNFQAMLPDVNIRFSDTSMAHPMPAANSTTHMEPNGVWPGPPPGFSPVGPRRALVTPSAGVDAFTAARPMQMGYQAPVLSLQKEEEHVVLRAPKDVSLLSRETVSKEEKVEEEKEEVQPEENEIEEKETRGRGRGRGHRRGRGYSNRFHRKRPSVRGKGPRGRGRGRRNKARGGGRRTPKDTD